MLSNQPAPDNESLGTDASTTNMADHGLLALTAEQLGYIQDDPYRRASLRVLDLIAFINAQPEEKETDEYDRKRSLDYLFELESLFGQIADNRTRRMLEGEVKS